MDPGAKLYLQQRAAGWAGFSDEAKGGVISAMMFAGFALLGFGLWAGRKIRGWMRERRRRRYGGLRDAEGGEGASGKGERFSGFLGRKLIVF